LADWRGLTSLWGADPSWGIRSTYPNRAAEYLGEDPVANLFVDAKGMLQRGGGPSGWDYAALALSTVPVVGPAAVRAAKPLAVATKKAVQDWGKRAHKMVDFNIDQPMTATSDATWKATGFRQTLQGKILEKLGMLPEYKDLVKMQKNADPMIQGWYDDYVLKGKSIEETLSKAVDDVALFSPTERALYDAHMREGKTAEEALELTLDAITGSRELIDEWLPRFNKSLDDNLSDWSKLRETTTLPEDVTQLGVSKPIQDMTWREWDNLSDESFGGAHGKLSAKQQDIMRAQGITNPDNILGHFWDKGARKEFVTALEQNVDALTSTKSGYTATMTEKQFKSDIAWKDSIADFKIVTEEVPIDPMVVAEKMAFKPDKVTHAEWARLTEDLTREEAIDLARRMTLRLID